MKARRIMALHDAQKRQKTVRKRSTRRSMAAALIGAAAVLAAGTVTVGAITHWQYNTLFNRFYGIDENAEDAYDFSGYGQDLNEVFTFPQATVTVTSMLADEYTLCFLYEVQYAPEVAADQNYMVHLGGRAEIGGKPVDFISEGTAQAREGDKSSGYVRFNAPDGCSWIGASLALGCDIGERSIGSGGSYTGGGNVVETDDLRQIDLQFVKPMQTVILDEPVSFVEYKVRHDFEYVKWSPVSLLLAPDEASLTREQKPPYTHGSTYFGGDAAAWNDSRWTLTAIGRDGTETPLQGELDVYGNGSEFFGDRFFAFYFDKPLDPETLEAIRINDEVIALHG